MRKFNNKNGTRLILDSVLLSTQEKKYKEFIFSFKGQCENFPLNFIRV